MILFMSFRVAVFDLVRLDSTFCVLCAWASKCEGVKEKSGIVLCLRSAETGRRFTDKRLGQVTAQNNYYKRREEEEEERKVTKTFLLVPLHQPFVFPLTHGKLMKTDFKGEDEKHSLLKAKCFTVGRCANTAALSEKWTTVELTNKSF